MTPAEKQLEIIVKQLANLLVGPYQSDMELERIKELLLEFADEIKRQAIEP